MRTPADEPVPRRLPAISEPVEHWLDTHHPDVIAINRVFAQQNVSTVMVGHAHSLFIAAISLSRLLRNRS